MLMEQICDYLTENPDRTSLRAIRAGVRHGRNPDKEDALEELIQTGHVHREQVGPGYYHTLIQRYTVAEDLATDQPCRTVPGPCRDGTGAKPEEHRAGPCPTPTPFGGGGTRHGSEAENRHVQYGGLTIDPGTGEILDEPGADP